MAKKKKQTSKLLILVEPPKGGSHFMDQLCTAQPDYQHELPPKHAWYLKARGPRGRIYVATKPPHQCPFYAAGQMGHSQIPPFSEVFLSPASAFPFEMFVAHAGRNKKRDKKKIVSGSLWTIQQLTDWCSHINIQVVHIIRNGLNQLASFKKHRDAVKRPITIDYCRKRAREFKQKVNNAIECQNTLPYYHIVRFGDLATEPMKILQKIKEWTGIPFDFPKIKGTHKHVVPNSSFRTSHKDNEFLKSFNPSHVLERWKHLPKGWRDCFYDEAGEELKKLGWKTGQ